MKVSIRTRLLSYFLFAALLPLLVLAVISTLTVNINIERLLDNSLFDTASIINISFNNIAGEINVLIFKIAVVISIASIMLSFIFAKLTAQPIIEITNLAKLIEKGDYAQRANITSKDEIGFLAKSFNSMSQALEKRKEAEQVRESLVTTITHDLKVPLLASLNALKYLENGSYGALSKDQSYITKQLILSQNQLLEMVKNILDVHKLEEKGPCLNKQKTKLDELVKNSVEDVVQLAQEKKLSVKTYCDTNLDVNIDVEQIKRVLQNFLFNSISYTPACGEITVTTKKEGSKAIVIIADNGIGINKEEQKTVFEKFSTCNKKIKNIGSGLGLYLSKLIIEAHSGEIGFESEQNVGSSFYFKLPL